VHRPHLDGYRPALGSPALAMLAEELHGPPPLDQQALPETLSVDAVLMSVGEPVTEGFGPRRYTTYRVVTDVREVLLGAFSGELALASGVACRRRFSDFLKLRADLLEALPGVIVPPLPEKQTVGAPRRPPAHPPPPLPRVHTLSHHQRGTRSRPNTYDHRA
jgi:hypothetical protein